MGRMTINESNIYAKLVLSSVAVTALLAVVTALAVSVRFGLSVLAGGLLATANFCWLRRGLERVLAIPSVSSAPRIATLRYLLRLAVMAGAIYLLMVRFRVDLFGLLIGLSVLVFNLMLFAIFLSTRKGG